MANARVILSLPSGSQLEAEDENIIVFEVPVPPGVIEMRLDTVLQETIREIIADAMTVEIDIREITSIHMKGEM